MSIESNLRVTSDRLLQTLDQLDQLETEKRTLKPGSDRFQTLAREIERLASEVFAQSHRQQTLGEQARTVELKVGTELPSIDETVKLRELPVILAEWRDAERRLSVAAADSAEHATATGDVARLRDEYRAAYSAGAGKSETDQGRKS